MPLELDYKKLYQTASASKSAYASAKPFPHIVLDGLFDKAMLKEVASEAAATNKDIEKKFYGSVNKHAASKRLAWGEHTWSLISELNSLEFISFLEELTGIEGIIPDPYFEGGGIHEIKKGGFLKVHTDFNYHRKMKLDRRINVLLYLNDDWQESYGGHLELWNEDMSERVQKVLPIINRLVVFSTTDFSYHGHPEPLTCPEDRSRRSIALYYYTNGRPELEVQFKESVSTNYQARPDEQFDRSIKFSFSEKMKRKWKKLKQS
ncbi:2OG-Fe(II) oxygenase [Agaribacterium sp. ZY112]|uniref:2OG-Fe(II) oxygenase n=1 Tax=Agaribacterium sp. ZY112 TaxID=3233574 RepID=UPI0035249CB7